MKIGIFGGTFDPVHQGHLALARAAKEQFKLDRIFFVPAFIPPHKSARRDLTPAPYRYRMVELAIRGEPAFEISDLEFSRPEISYTVETLRDFKKKFPGDELYLLMGADALAEVPKWREPDRIRKMAVLLVARRRGVEAQIPAGWRAEWIGMRDYPIASSEIRRQFREKGRAPDDALPQEVRDYIQKMNLYGKGGAPCSLS